MSEQQIVYVKGPMHPDLFDGQTPMIQPVEIEQALKVFTVDVTVHKAATLHVVAQDEEQAEEIAEQRMEDDADIDFEIEVTGARENNHLEPDDLDIEDWVRWQKSKTGALS